MESIAKTLKVVDWSKDGAWEEQQIIFSKQQFWGLCNWTTALLSWQKVPAIGQDILMFLLTGYSYYGQV